MRLAVISDIHANLEALREVLVDIERSDVDTVMCLGDIVGYGPDPEGVVLEVAGRGIPSVMGNHDFGIVEPSFLGWFNPQARRSLEITRSLLSRESIEALGKLERSRRSQGCLFVHGFPPDSLSTYLFEVSEAQLESALLGLGQAICFVGHTHELLLVSFDGKSVRQAALGKGAIQLKEDHAYIINAGSVGQPRDGDRSAKYLIWDDGTRYLEVRYVPYDSSRTVCKILELGFPPINAQRLQ